MHDDRLARIARFRLAAALATLAVAGAFPSAAIARAGLDLSAGSSLEEYSYPHGRKSVSSEKITLSPWWSNDDWRLSADIPFINRDMEASGTVPVCTSWSLLLRRCVAWTTATVNFTESDSGIGDAWLHATRSWQAGEYLTTYVSGHVRLPTGSEDTSPGLATIATRATARSAGFNDYTLGKDGVDFRLAPGATLANEYLWATMEPAWIFTSSTGAENRGAFYAGVGVTPWKYVEASVGFDYEDEDSPGSGTLEQVTYSITLRPTDSLSITASTYDDDDPSSPDSNWSIGASAHW